MSSDEELNLEDRLALIEDHLEVIKEVFTKPRGILELLTGLNDCVIRIERGYE